MAITRAQIAKELVPGLNALFGLEYNKYPEEYKDLYTTENSDKAYEEEVKLSGFGAAAVKPEGEGVQFDEAGEVYTSRYVHETVALAFAITEEAMEDNLYETLSSRYTKALARSMAHTKNVKGAAILNRAFDVLAPGGDGQPLCSASHPLSGSGTISNVGSADLAEASLEAAVTQMTAWTDERGLLIAAKPKKLIIHAQNAFNASRLLDSQYRPGTGDNDINVIYTNGVVPQGYMVNHYLLDTDAWWLTTDVQNGLKHFERAALKTGSEGDFDTGNMRYRARARYCFGFSDPLGIFGSPGA